MSTPVESGVRTSIQYRLPWTVTLLISAVVLLSKAPDALLKPQFWAEDGSLFFLQQHGLVFPKLFTSYAGYLHFLPRLVAWGATAFPTGCAPLIYNASALLLAAAAIASLRRLESFGLPFAIVLLPLALVPTSGEIFGTITNVQWFSQLYLVSMFARSYHGATDPPPHLRAVFAGAVGLTGPFVLFALPSAVAGWIWMFWRTDRLSKLAEFRIADIPSEWMVLVVCAVIQLANLVGAGSNESPLAAHSFQPDSWILFASSLQIHVFGMRVMPTGMFLAIILFLPWFAGRGADPRLQALLVAFSLTFALQLVATALRFSSQPGLLLPFANGDRYFFLFKVSFWWLVACAIRRVLPRSKLFPIGVVATLLLINASFVPDTLYRQPLQDLHWADYVDRIDAGQAVDVPINPPPWKMHVTARN